jgi:trigger factor
MNITKQNTDEINAVLTLKIGKEDYEERVENILKDYRKKAHVHGFRPGKVPAGMINKMYRKPVLVDEINKLVSESLGKYISDEKLKILGEPLPNEAQKRDYDWDNDSEFEFVFDLGLAPEFDVQITSKNKFTTYKIKSDDKFQKEYIENYTRRYGKYENTETIEGKELLKGIIRQVDEAGNVVEGGIVNEASSMALEVMKDDSVLKKFKKAKVGDKIVFDVKKAYPNDTELSYILKTDKAKIEQIKPLFELEIQEILEFRPAQLNEEFYEKAFGKDVVKTEADFQNKINEEIQRTLINESGFKFNLDVKAELLKKANIKLPAEFLKRWLYLINEGKVTKENIDKDFSKFDEDLKWQLIRDKIAKDNEIKITDEEVLEQAKQVARMQFQQYGLFEIPEEHLTQYAGEILKREDDQRRIVEKIIEDKVFAFIKTTAKLDEKEISVEKFKKLAEEN